MRVTPSSVCPAKEEQKVGSDVEKQQRELLQSTGGIRTRQIKYPPSDALGTIFQVPVKEKQKGCKDVKKQQ
jgi:hypothetical protein